MGQVTHFRLVSFRLISPNRCEPLVINSGALLFHCSYFRRVVFDENRHYHAIIPRSRNKCSSLGAAVALVALMATKKM